MDVADDMKASDTCMIKRNIGNLPEEKFNIYHIILQFESNACDDISLDRQSKDRQFGRH